MIVECLATIIVLLTLSAYSPPIGGVLYALFTTPLTIPGFGKLYRLLIDGPVKTVFAVKATCWFVSGLTPIAVLHAVFLYYPVTRHNAGILLGVGVSGLLIALQTMARVITFEVSNYASIDDIPMGIRKVVLGSDSISAELRKRLSRSQFVDMTIISLLSLVSGFAMLILALQEFELVTFQPFLSVIDATFEASSLLTMIGDSSRALSGPLASYLVAVIKFTAFIFLVFFMSLAPGLVVSDGSSRDRDS